MSNDLTRLGNYQLLERLGQGGMGTVYKARDVSMDRVVVVKLINGRHLGDAAAAARFKTEVRAAARLENDNIVRAYHAELDGDPLFLVMELVDGIDLEALVRKKGPLPVEQAAHFARQVALGLQHAHEKQLVHRDVKPKNIMVTRKGQVKILDFGLAKLRSDRRSNPGATAVDTMMGTPDYISPEQSTNARDVDIRADIYSLGCTLWYLLTGKPPFASDNPLEVIIAHNQDERPWLLDRRPDAPRELAEVVRKMMARSADERYSTPAEVARALQPFAFVSVQASVPTATPMPSPARVEQAGPIEAHDRTRARLPTRRRYSAWKVALGGALVSLSASLFAWILATTTAKGLFSGEAAGIRKQRPEAIANNGQHDPAELPGKDAGATKQPPKPRQLDPKVRAVSIYGGNWKIDKGEVTQDDMAYADFQIAFGDESWTDYDLTCEARVLGGHGEFTQMFRVVGRDRFEFTLGKWDGAWQSLGWLSHNDLDRLKNRKTQKLTPNQWYALEVRVRGNAIQCWVDMELVFACNDGRNPKGKVGLRTWWTAASFRNIQVTNPAGVILFEGLPDLPSFNR